MENLNLNQIMKRALELASQARGRTAPNPAVGAVVVNFNGDIIGEGFHPKAGEPHAEVFAIQEALQKHSDLSSCVLFVTLEPCNHQGRTPPCADLILKTGIKTIVIGEVDANPKMRGKSLKLLTEHGVDVIPPVMLSREIQNEARELIRGFTSIQQNGRPFITLKAAVSLDGKIATASGESKWITSSDAREFAHKERASHQAVLVGVGTVLKDDPSLNIRLKEQEPQTTTRVILDSRLLTPPAAKLFSADGPVFIFCDQFAPTNRRQALENAGAEIIAVPTQAPGTLDLHEVLAELAERNLHEILVEGGAKVLGAFAREKLFDRVLYFMAPKILGSHAIDVFDGFEVTELKNCIELSLGAPRILGQDILIEGRRG